jgi:hypothetical protein
MARDHILPAAFIGSFSNERITPLRRRHVAVIRRGSGLVTTTRAESIAFENRLYDMKLGRSRDDPPVRDLDRTWQRYEDNLNAALDRLAGRQAIDASTWLRTLVPFCAGLMCRHPEFASRATIEARVLSPNDPHRLQRVSDEERVNAARWLEMNFLLTPILAASWTVHHLPATCPDVTTDLGFCAYRNTSGETGIIVPISRRAALGLIPKRRRTVLTKRDGRWLAPIAHVELAPGFATGLARVMARCAPTLVIGAKESDLADLTTALAIPAARAPTLTGLAAITRWELYLNHMAWPCLVTAVETGNFTEGPMTNVDWDLCMSRGWSPPPLIGDPLIAPANVTSTARSVRLSLTGEIDRPPPPGYRGR